MDRGRATQGQEYSHAKLNTGIDDLVHVFGEKLSGSLGPLVTFPWPRDVSTHELELMYVYVKIDLRRYCAVQRRCKYVHTLLSTGSHVTHPHFMTFALICY